MGAVSGATAQPRARPSAPPALRRLAGAAVAGLPAALLVALWLLLIVEDGGYFPRAWYPAAIATVVLLAAVAGGGRRVLPEPRPVRIALACLAGLVAWSYLSLAWSGSRGDAYEAANELLLVLATAWCMAIQPLGARGLLALFGAWSCGVAAICAVRLLDAMGASDPSGFLDPTTRRPNDPMVYPNATAAVAVMALLPALVIASRRGVPAAVRGGMFAVATFLGTYALLPQTRGAAVGIALALPVLVFLSPDRIRLLVRLLVAGGLVALAAPAVLDVADASIARRPIAGALDDAGAAMALSALLALVAGVLLALVDARVKPWQPSGKARRDLAVAGAVGAVLIAGVGAVALGPRIVDWAESTWSSQGPDPAKSRLLSLSPEERPDYARVALDLFGEQPIGGVGIGNFGREYDARRTLPKHSRYTHNLPLRAASETGLIGLLLLVGVLGCLAWGALLGRRRAAPEARAAAAAALGIGAYLLGHSMLDWLEEFHSLTGPAIGFAFAALALPDRSDAELPWWERLHRRNRPTLVGLPRPVAIGAGVSGGVIALIALIPGWFAVRYLERAREGTVPAQVRSDLEQAADLNPFSSAPLLGEGRLAIELGRADEARDAYERALDREETWTAYLQLALLDAQAGRWQDARSRLEQASTLSANDAVIAEAEKRVLRRIRVDPAEFDRTVVERPVSAGGDIG